MILDLERKKPVLTFVDESISEWNGEPESEEYIYRWFNGMDSFLDKDSHFSIPKVIISMSTLTSYE